MGQLFYGSICLSDLIENAKKKHSAFSKGQNGKIYASVNVWLNDEKDKFGNIMSVQINPTKEMKDLEDRVYIGNLKQSDGPKPVNDKDVSGIQDDFDVPQREPKQDTYKYADDYDKANLDKPESNEDATQPIDDLPF